MKTWLTISDVCRLVPGARGPLTPETVRNWCRRGVRGVCLRHRYVGGRLATTAEWLDLFIDQCTEKRNENRTKELTSPAFDSRCREKAAEFLKSRGAI